MQEVSEVQQEPVSTAENTQVDQASQVDQAQPDLTQDLFAKVEAPLEADPKSYLLSRLTQTDTVNDSAQVLDEYLEAGGSLEQLQQQPNLTEQAKFAVQHELELRQILITSRELLINPASTSEQLQPVLTELLNTRDGAEEQLFTSLENDISANQRTRLQTEIQTIKKQEQDKRLNDLQQFHADLTPEEQAELAQSVDAYPSLIAKLDLTPEEQVQLETLKTASENTADNTPQNEPTSETPRLRKQDYIFFALMYLKEPRRFQQILNRIVQEKTIDPLLAKLGINPDLIDTLKNFRYNPSEELLQNPTNLLYRQLQRMDRYEMRDFLEDLKEEDRLQLVTGEHRYHQFSKDERQELFYANGKLTAKDCEQLEIPTEVK